MRIFGTEETREINTMVIPKSVNDSSQTARVVFLASKHKAPESRFSLLPLLKDITLRLLGKCVMKRMH